MATQSASYPVSYDIDVPESLSRWLWLFKGFLLIPHMIILWFLGVASMFVLALSWLIIVITGRQPKSLWDFLLGVNRWSLRTNAYASHMTDKYPPFSMSDEPTYPVRINAEFATIRSRLSVFFRWFMLIPQWIVVWFLSSVFWILMWINILIVIFSGKPHSEIFEFMIGMNRWMARVNLYGQLITDQYPPFSLE